MLCDPLSDFNNSPILAEASVEQQLLLLYVVEKDLSIIVGFYKKEIPPDRDEQAMLVSFKQMFLSFAKSSGSQAFMVWLGGTPLFEVEIHDAKMHFPYEEAYIPEEKEYFMILKAGGFDQTEFPVYIRGLRLCLDYFLSFPEVQGIITLVNAGPYEQQQASLFLQAGMTKTLEITSPDQAELYRIS
ncbi:MAG TPA: hypothetical protein VF939_04920 [Puia sp.]